MPKISISGLENKVDTALGKNSSTAPGTSQNSGNSGSVAGTGTGSSGSGNANISIPGSAMSSATKPYVSNPSYPRSSSSANADLAFMYYLLSGEDPYKEIMNGQNGLGSILGGAGGSMQQSSSSVKPSTENRDKTETAIADLRNKYSGQIRNQYENSVKRLEKERNDALRENWILQQRAEAALPEQMAAAGINGGASETTLANLRAQYQGNRNDIRSGYMENLGELLDKQNKAQAEGADKYDRMWLDYLLSLAKAEQEHEYDLEEAEQKYKYERLLG